MVVLGMRPLVRGVKVHWIHDISSLISSTNQVDFVTYVRGEAGCLVATSLVVTSARSLDRNETLFSSTLLQHALYQSLQLHGHLADYHGPVIQVEFLGRRG